VSLSRVSIHYRRLPDRTQIFEQVVLEETPEVTVTFLEAAALPRNVVSDDDVLLEPGAPVVWFTYPERWYDIGRFHRADGTFTGFYANLISPVKMEGRRWETTDLCLDVWAGADGSVRILDQDEFQEAVTNGWIDSATEATAREHAEALARAARQGTWPSDHVRGWTLERARQRLHELSGR
jgi:predicted RNA-binding protein associated with RNAse of E/G family